MDFTSTLWTTARKTFKSNNPRKKKLQENIFFQNVTVVHTSTLLTSLPKSFRKLLSVLSKKNKIISGYFKFYEEKMILWILRIMFWQPLLLLSTEHFAESARTIKILWILQKTPFSQKKISRTRKMKLWQRKLFFAVSTRKKNTCGYVKFLTRKRSSGHLEFCFDKPSCFFHEKTTND